MRSHFCAPFRTTGFRLLALSLPAILPSLFCSGCFSFSEGNTRIESENNILRNRLTLVERRNAVLEDETISLRETARNQDARIAALEAEKAAQKEAHTKEMRLAESRYTNLNSRYELLTKESDRRIKELTELSKKIELDYEARLRTHNEESTRKQAESLAALEDERRKASAREAALQREIDLLKRELESRSASANDTRNAP
jgi:hypothetical protein